MKVNIKGAYGEANFGDDLLMVIFENFFYEEVGNVKLNFIGAESDYVLKLLKDKSTYLSDYNGDWLVYGGGTQFFYFGKKKFNKSLFFNSLIGFLVNPKKIWEKFYKKSKIHINDSKICFLGIGIGPFKGNDSGFRKVEMKLRNAQYIGVRDDVSLKYCLNSNIDAIFGADVVFSDYFKLPKLSKELKTNKKKKIGLIVRDWGWEEEGEAYIEKLLNFYKKNKEKDDEEYQFIIFSSIKDKDWILRLKQEQILLWMPKTDSIDDFVLKLNDFDAFISARYHGAIIGVLLSKPVICVEIEPKLELLTNQLKELKLWRKPFEEADLVELINSLDYNISYKSLNSLRIRSNNMLSEFSAKFKDDK